ncbi:MAG: phthiocerol/phthiodiolone dimycocerosyl transferase family protein [Segniliparus sp.]|uniref:phthiocerol/phthiodiolone dimycocerosyl transferase family protein n=1 Tax=Segniliparus sp. TaxID=2804064 RepID=UPI003F410880
MTSVRIEAPTARELSGMESFMAGMSATINAVIQGRGRLDEGALRAALALLRAKYPVVGGRVVRAADGKGHTLLLDRADAPVCTIDDGDLDRPLQESDLLLVGGEALAVRVARRGDRFRLVFSCHHSLADGRVMITYLAEFFALYTSLVTTGSAEAGPPRPLPLPPEEVLSERGVKKLAFDEFLRQSYGEEAAEFFTQAMSSASPCEAPEAAEEAAERAQFAVAHDRLRLSRGQTAALIALSKRSQVSVHGLVSAAAVLAELLAPGSPDFLILQLRSAVDVRTRVSPSVEDPMSVTNFSGNSTTLVLAQRGDDPVAWAKQVRDQIAVDLERGIMPQSLLQMSGLTNIMRELSAVVSQPMPDTVFITNVGVLPDLPVPDGMVIEDVHGVIHSSPSPEQFDAKAQQAIGASRNHSYLVSTFDDRLSLDLFQFVSGEADTAPIIGALQQAFDALLSE